MASALAAQLRTIVLAQGGATPQQSKGRPSLLFGPQEAADIDQQTILGEAQRGLAELSEHDRRFEPFGRTLFAPESQHLDREMEPPSVSSHLDVSITTFMRLLTPYLLLAPAQKAFEYLLRKYRVEVYNVEAVMRAALPYHDTNLFVRIVQLLHIQGTRWQFLEGVQQSGAAVPRRVLAQRCCRDFGLLETVCEMAKDATTAPEGGRPTLSFWAVLVMETLAAIPAISSDLVARLLPYLLHGFHKSSPEDYTAGALMIIAQLANRVTLSGPLLETLFEALAKAGGAGLAREKLMVMLQLDQTQTLAVFPAKAFNHLVKMSDLPELLGDFSRQFSSTHFIAIFLKALIQHSVNHSNYEELLVRCTSKIPLAENVTPMVTELLGLCFGPAAAGADEAMQAQRRENPASAVVRRVLKEIGKHYPKELDGTMKHLKDAVKAAKGGRKELPVAGMPSTEQELVAFFSDVLHGTLHEPLLDTRASLFQSIEHPEPSVKKAAIRQISEVLEGAADDEQRQMAPFARGALLRCLEDSDWGVVSATMEVTKLADLVPGEQLLGTLEKVAEAAISAMGKGTKWAAAGPRVALKKLLKLLTTGLMPRHPELKARASRIIVAFLLITPSSRKLSTEALRLAAAAPFPLFEGLSDVVAALDAAAGKAGDKGATTKKLKSEGKLNRQIVAALTRATVRDEGSYDVFFHKHEKAAGKLADRARLLTMLVLLHGIQVAPEGVVPKLLADALPLLRNEWAAVEHTPEFQEAEFLEVDVVGWDRAGFLPPDTIIASLFAGDEEMVAYAGLVRTAAYVYTYKLASSKGLFAEADRQYARLVEEAYAFMAGSSRPKLFLRHVTALLERCVGFPGESIRVFLTRYFAADGSEVAAGLQAQSLVMLISYLISMDTSYSSARSRAKDAKQAPGVPPLQSVLPPLLVASSSPSPIVRKAAWECIEHVDRVAARSDSAESGVAPHILSDRDFLQLMDVVCGRQNLVEANGERGLPLVAKVFQIAKTQPLTAGTRVAIVSFLTAHALLQPESAQLVLLSALTDVGYNVVRTETTAGALRELLKVRREQHLHHSQGAAAERPRAAALSAKQLGIVKVLLSSYDSWVASRFEARKDLAANFFAALEVEGGRADDPVVNETTIAACSCTDDGFYAACGMSKQEELLGALLLVIASNAADDVRSAARAALQRIELSAATVVYHLNLLARKVENMSKRAREKRARHAEAQEPERAAAGVRERTATWPPTDRAVPFAAALLEMLRWKKEIRNMGALVPALEELLRALLKEGERMQHQPPARQGPLSEGRAEGAPGGAADVLIAPAGHLEGQLAGGPPDVEMDSPETPAPPDAEGEVAVSPTEGAGGVSPAPGGKHGEGHSLLAPGKDQGSIPTFGSYIQQLILMVLASLAGPRTATPATQEWDGHPPPRFDVGVPVLCVVSSAADAAARNGAMVLLTALTALQPGDVLQHVLGLLSAMGSTALALDDSHSHELARQLVAAVLPVWLSQNDHDLSKLLQVVVDVLPSVPPAHRVALGITVLESVSVERGLPVLLQLLLEAEEAPLPEPSGHKKGQLRPRQLGRGNKGRPAQQPAAHQPSDPWIAEFREQLLGQLPLRVRLASFVGLLERMRPDSPGREEGANQDAGRFWSLQRAVTEFVASQLRPVLLPEGPAGAEDAPVQEAHVALLEQVLLYLRAPRKGPRGGRAEQEAATAAAYGLLGVLNDVMAPASYLQGIASILSHEDSLMRRKVLRLLAAKALEERMEVTLPRKQRRARKGAPAGHSTGSQGNAGGAEATGDVLAEEGVQYARLAERIAGLLSGPDEDASDATQLAALQALEAVARRFAPKCPIHFRPTLLAVLPSLHASNLAVAAAAVRLVATLAAALGPASLPQLAKTVAELLQASAAAASRVAASPLQAGEGAAEEEGEAELGTDVSREGAVVAGAAEQGEPGARQVAVQAAAFLGQILAAWETIVRELGAFLSPYLRDILEFVMLQPGHWPEGTGIGAMEGVVTQAATIQGLCAEKIPPRLLLDPLLGLYDKALRAGAPSAAALLRTLGMLAARLDQASVASYHARIFEFLLAAMDLRRAPPAAWAAPKAGTAGCMPGGVAQVEAAAVSAMAALALKLSESSFKPLFVRVLDWASNKVVDGGEAGPNGSTERHIALFGLVNVLFERLRSIMVPYFRYLIDLSVQLLTGQQAADRGAAPKRKKQRTGAGSLTVAQWQLRHLVVTALHKCFLYDTSGFLDSARFERLLDPLTSQIGCLPPAMVPEGESRESLPDWAASYPAASTPTAKQMAAAVVACLGQMALTANSDMLWKPLNYKVLMHTRSGDARTRLTALEVVRFLAERLKEEYAVLLPETMPFLIELLEDPDMAVVAAAQGIIETLEQLGGEDLNKYF